MMIPRRRLTAGSAAQHIYPALTLARLLGVDHAPHCTAVLDGPNWVVIWVARLEHNPADPWVPIRRGLHILRPVSWQRVREARLASAYPDGPTTLWWHHQFLHLWDYSGQLGMHHVAVPQADTPPRFLLSGQAWFRLWRVSEVIDICCGPDWHPSDDFFGELSVFLHPELSYPAVHGPARAELPRTELPSTVFRSRRTTYGQLDIAPRLTIHRALRRWIARRRRLAALARAAGLRLVRLLPGELLALPPLVLQVAWFL